jgi:hypothetical protein
MTIAIEIRDGNDHLRKRLTEAYSQVVWNVGGIDSRGGSKSAVAISRKDSYRTGLRKEKVGLTISIQIGGLQPNPYGSATCNAGV